MKKMNYTLLCLITTFLFIRCAEIFEINDSSVRSKIVLNGIIEPDSIVKIKVSKTYPLQYADTLQYNQILPQAIIKNATLTLFVNDENIGKMTEISIDSNKYNTGTFFQSNYRPKCGDKIRIEASAQGFKSVWAETKIPDSILINKVDTSTYYFKNDYFIDGYYDYIENTYHSVTSDFKIPTDAKSMNLNLKIGIENNNINENYYALSVYQKIKDTYNTWYYQPHIDLAKEPLFNNNNAKNSIYAFFSEESNSGYRAKIFRDDLFNNGKYTLNTSLWGYYFYRIATYYGDGTVGVKMYNVPIEILIHSLSKELYNYILSHTNSSYEQIPYIFESNATYTNVHNGLGVVGAQTITKRKIVMKQYKGKYDPKTD